MKLQTDSLRAERLARGLTQEALARRADVARSVIQFAEQGRRTSVRADTLSKLARALGCTVADIAQGENDAETVALARQAEVA